MSAAAVLVAIIAAPASARPDAFSFVQVVEKEWSLVLSRQSIRAGSVSLELVNFGMDNHDLVVQSAKPGSKPVRYKQLAPRARAEKRLRVAAGRYLLWCSLPGHKAKGMRATLRVNP